MKQALESLNNAYNACLCYTPVDLLEIDVRASLDAILDLLGERSKVDLDKEIFSKFCLGK
jgi:tRNA modification GTPase